MSEPYIPRDFSTEVIQFATKRNYAGIFLDPGLGKTGIALAVFKLLRKHQGRQRAFIIAPKAVINTTWPAEIAKWDQFKDFTYALISGTRKQRYQALNSDADIYLLSPENLAWLIAVGGFRRINCDVLFIDESTRFKNHAANRFLDFIAGRGSEWNKSSLNNFKNRYILTGTPIPKGLHDIWAQIFLLDGGYHLGKNITAFRNKYFNESVRGNYRHYQPTDRAQQTVQDLIKPFCIRMKAEDHIDMPELLEYEVECELPKNIMARYKLLESEFFVMLDEKKVTAANAGVLMAKLQQFAQGAVYLSDDPFEPLDEVKPGKVKEWEKLHDAKIERLDLLLDELEDQPVIIAYAFKHDAVRLVEYLKKRSKSTGSQFIHLGAGVNRNKLNDAVNRWNAKKVDHLLVQPKIVAHGLNIQYGGHHIIMFGNTWNFEDYDQLRRRLYRPGQPDNKVIVHRLVGKGTVDNAIIMRLSQRGDDQETFVKVLQHYRQQKLAA